MTHHGDPTEHEAGEAADQQEQDPTPQADRPDTIGVRGNPDVEQGDVDRGEGKLGRITGN